MRKYLLILFTLLSLISFGQDGYTVILLHGNGTDASTLITDEYGNKISIVGNAQLDTTYKKFGTASILLDGNGDKITSAYSTVYLKDKKFTFDFWFKSNTIASYDTFFSKYVTGASPEKSFFKFDMGVVSGNTCKPRFYAANNISGTGTTVAGYEVTTAVTINDGNFHHFEVVRDGSNFYIFLDGTSLSLTTVTAISTNYLDNTDGVLNIGDDLNNTPRFVDGWIDEFRLSLGVARHTSNFSVATTEYAPATDPTFLLTDSLRAYWKFDEASGNAASEVNSNTLTNRNTTDYAAGKINNSPDFILADSNYFDITDANQTGLDITDEISFSFWTKLRSQPPTYNKYHYFINKWENTTGKKSYSVGYSTYGGLPYLYIATTKGTLTASNTHILTATTLTNDVWYHIVISTNSITNIAKFYINDTLRGTINGSADSDSIYDGTGDIRVGTSADGGRFDGTMDEMAIYNRLLYQTDVAYLWNEGDGCQYDFSACTSTSNIKTYNTNVLLNIKSINGNAINNVKTLNTNTNK